MDRSAKPTEDCLFINPLKEGVLKLHNITRFGGKRIGGIISAYNVSGQQQKVTFSARDIPDIEVSEHYWIYDFIKKKVQFVGKNDKLNDEIESGGFGWYVILPEVEHLTCFGLLDKYVGFQAVESIVENNNAQIIVLHSTGTVGWASKQAAKKVIVNNVELTKEVKQNGDFYTISVPENDSKEVIIIEW